MEQNRALLSPNRAAEMLDISRTTVYSLMKAKRIRYVLVGKDRRIPMDEIQRIASEGTTQIAAAA